LRPMSCKAFAFFSLTQLSSVITVPPEIAKTPVLAPPLTGTAHTSCENADMDGAMAEGTGWPWYFMVVVPPAKAYSVTSNAKATPKATLRYQIKSFN